MKIRWGRTAVVVLVLTLGVVTARGSSKSRVFSPWSKQELSTLNELINKNATFGYTNSGDWIPGRNQDAVLSGLKNIQLSLVISGLDNINSLRKTLQNDLRHELEQAGISVADFYTRTDGNRIVVADKDTPILHIKIVLYQHPYLQLYSYSCRVSLIEQVHLNRDTDRSYFAETWWTTTQVGTVSKVEVSGAVAGSVKSWCQFFVSSYLGANPAKLQK